jgi:LysM repeat protein
MTRRLLILLVLVLTLSGCFRQAGEELVQPDSSSTQTDSGAGEPTPTSGDSSVTVIPSLDDVETPTDTAEIQDAGDDETPPTETPTEEEILPSFDTPAAPIGATSEIIEPTVTPTQQVFLTPGGGLPITPQTSQATPTDTNEALVTPTSFIGTSPTGDGCTYIVQPGDTLYRIAINNNITLEQLRAANPEVQGDLIQVEQVLNIPGCGQGLDEEGNPVGGQPPASTAAASGQVIHTVVAGDTLVRIARQYGVTVQDIVNANSLVNPNQIDVGQQLIIPVPTPVP